MIPKGAGGSISGPGAVLFVNYLKQVFRLSGGDDYDLLMSYLAMTVQFLGTLITKILALLGAHGTGKSTLATIITMILGAASCAKPQSMAEFTETFYPLDNKAFCFVDECLYVGDDKGAEILKLRATEAILDQNTKYGKIRPARNHLSIMLATNHRIPVKTAEDSRRFIYYTTHRVPNPAENDRNTDNGWLFAPLFDEANLLDIAELLHNYPINHELLSKPPVNEALVTQRVLSLTGVGAFVADCLSADPDNQLCSEHGNKDHVIRGGQGELHDLYRDWKTKVCRGHGHVLSVPEFRRVLSEYIPAKFTHLGAGGRMGKYMRVAPYKDCMLALAVKLNTTPDLLKRKLQGGDAQTDEAAGPSSTSGYTLQDLIGPAPATASEHASATASEHASATASEHVSATLSEHVSATASEHRCSDNLPDEDTYSEEEAAAQLTVLLDAFEDL